MSEWKAPNSIAFVFIDSFIKEITVNVFKCKHVEEFKFDIASKEFVFCPLDGLRFNEIIPTQIKQLTKGFNETKSGEFQYKHYVIQKTSDNNYCIVIKFNETDLNDIKRAVLEMEQLIKELVELKISGKFGFVRVS